MERRREVARLRLAGVRDQREIAMRLGVSQPTISRDCDAIDAALDAETVTDTAAAKRLDLARVEAAIVVIWAQVMDGKLFAIDRLVSLMAHKAKLLGLETTQPQQIDINLREHRRAVPQSTIDRIIQPAEHRMDA